MGTRVTAKAGALGWALVLGALVAPQAGHARDDRSEGSGPDFSVDAQPQRVPQGGLITVWVRGLRGAVPKVTDVRFGDARVASLPWGTAETLALVPVSITHALGTHPVRLRVGGTVVSLPVAVVPGDFDTDELGVSRSFTDPTRAQRRRAHADAQALEAMWRRGSAERLWRGPFILPVDNAVTAPFGTFRTINGRTRSRHQGLDVRGRVGDPIRATNDGRVALARDCFFSGNTVVLDHGAGLYTLYFHMSRMSVKPGERVRRGQQLGLVGQTGRVTGPHLHWGVKLAGRYVDGQALLALDLSGDPKATPAQRNVAPAPVKVPRRVPGAPAEPTGADAEGP